MDLENEEQFDELVQYLRNAVEKIVYEKFPWKAANHTLDPSYISSRLVEILKNSLNNERENYLQQLLNQLSQLSLQKQSMEKELNILKGSGAKETIKYQQENAALRKKFASLETELKSLEIRQAQKEKFYQEKLDQKRNELQKLQTIFSQAKETEQDLNSQLSSLKIATIQMERNQIQLIREAKMKCKAEIGRKIDSQIAKQNSIDILTRKQLETKLNAARLEEKKAERICQNLLDAIWTMKDGSHPNITPAQFPDRVDEVCSFIDSALQEQEQKTLEELRSEVRVAIPDIEFGNKTISDAINDHLQKMLRQKEAEYEKVLHQGQIREKKLRKKLQDALNQIHQFHDDLSKEEEEKVLSELDQLTNEWDQQKSQLDAKMEALKTLPLNQQSK